MEGEWKWSLGMVVVQVALSTRVTELAQLKDDRVALLS